MSSANTANHKRKLLNMGCVNEADPLTGLPLDTNRPLVALVNKDTCQLTAFDLYSLYNMHIKKGRKHFRTFDGHFKLDSIELKSIASDYIQYYSPGLHIVP